VANALHFNGQDWLPVAEEEKGEVIVFESTTARCVAVPTDARKQYEVCSFDS
jgi:hypothetical protein